MRPHVVEHPLSLEQLASAARECRLLAAAGTLAEWIGTGRPVTTRGVLKPAAAVEACDLLGIELPTRKPRSALDIGPLMMVWAAASAAGFIEVDRGRVTTGLALRQWTAGTSEDVVAIWTRCAAEALGLAGSTDPADLDFLVLLATLHERDGAATMDELGENLFPDDDALHCSCPDCMPGSPRRLLSDDVDFLDSTEDIEDLVAALSEFGIAVLRGESAELTPLGRWFTDFLFRQSAPTADADAATMVHTVAPLPDPVIALMSRPWLSARTPAAAARELIATGEATSGQERLTALTLARECGPDAAPAWREWAAKDGFGAHARVWLAEQDDSEPADTDLAWITADTLDVLLRSLPPELPAELLSAAIQAQAGAEIGRVLPLLAGSGHPAAPRLVELLTSSPVDALAELGGLLPGMSLDTTAPADRPVSPARSGRSAARYQIKVQLRGVAKPPVWRRLEVPADLSLDRLHDVIQAAMGWYDCHLHVFSDGWTEYGRPDPELGHRDERGVRLSQILTGVDDKIRYTYDFGDGWEHDITLEKILPAGSEVTSAVCTAGRGACPPEDCGGTWGYQELKATLADPKAHEHDTMVEWLNLASGDNFDPHEFSTVDVNRRLSPSV
ncbi:plasmid pRiA4b ORF-3 family protein [Amycolatopsis taiwanensis]|uniref:plasmid pRiA4b ORF-3 family protein n=1 Tax=Amycolatopsis taiwanensis TaxID=342230 RepID=UPI002552E967|nr:plasmid pRiA4b ORF-3 family protein [Amycolatopsis taiwanensis]